MPGFYAARSDKDALAGRGYGDTSHARAVAVSGLNVSSAGSNERRHGAGELAGIGIGTDERTASPRDPESARGIERTAAMPAGCSPSMPPPNPAAQRRTRCSGRRPLWTLIGSFVRGCLSR